MDALTPAKQDFVNAFLAEPRIARMATANQGGQPHVVPVWYAWDGQSIWISAYSDTRKAKDLQENPLLSVAIDDVSPDGKTQAVILEGKAELLRGPAELLQRQFTWIYSRYVWCGACFRADLPGMDPRPPECVGQAHPSQDLHLELVNKKLS